MKRKLMYNDSKSIYAAPALESTLLLESGGLEDKNPIGALPSTNISAAVSSGTRTFQYNRYFWNKELFSFNYANCAIGVAIAYFSRNRGTNGAYCFSILPIFLPHSAMTLLQSVSSGSVTDDPVTRTLLMQELVFYLNLGFTSLGVGNTYGLITNGAGFKIAPWVTAFDGKGSPYNPADGSQIVNNGWFPIFQDGATEPPLVWTYNGNNNQLCLTVNNSFGGFAIGDRIGFQIVTLEPYMAEAPVVSNPGFPGGFQPTNTYFPQTFNNYPPASYGDGTGWCCQGAFSTGFGQTSSYSSYEDAQESPTTYTDIYTPAERLALWQATKFPVRTTNQITLSQFANLCQQFKLVSNTGNGTGILVSRFITSLIPARFFAIDSDALTRNQKRPVVSNNPTIAPACMAIQFLTLDTLRTWEDNTVAGLTSSAGSILFGSRKSGVDDCSIVALDPMQSLQTIDLILRDEWGNVLQNYTQLQHSNSAQQYNSLGYFDGFAVTPTSWFPIPVWAATFNPIPSANDESILINESWWNSVYQFYGFNPVSTANPTQDSDFKPSMPQSATFTHFGRVLGY